MSGKKHTFSILSVPLLAYAFVFLFLLFADSKVSSYLYVLLLFLPLLDPRWRIPGLKLLSKLELYVLLSGLCVTVLLLMRMPERLEYFLIMLFFTAIPEEWFFRAYLLGRAGFNLQGNIIVSAAFSVLHGLSQNIHMMYLVFLPSMLFGYVYIKIRSIYVVILLHALSNLVFMMYLKKWLESYMA